MKIATAKMQPYFFFLNKPPIIANYNNLANLFLYIYDD